MRRTRKKDRYGSYDTLFDQCMPYYGQTFTVSYIADVSHRVLNTRIRHDAEENGCKVSIESNDNHFMVTVSSYDFRSDFGRILYSSTRKEP